MLYKIGNVPLTWPDGTLVTQEELLCLPRCRLCSTEISR